jgi:hypothetical protein
MIGKTGRVLVVACVAEEYGFTDVDGKRPRALTVMGFGVELRCGLGPHSGPLSEQHYAGAGMWPGSRYKSLVSRP